MKMERGGGCIQILFKSVYVVNMCMSFLFYFKYINLFHGVDKSSFLSSSMHTLQ